MKEERNRVYIRSCKMVLWPIRARVLFELFYKSTREFLRTLEKSQKHEPKASAFLHFSRVLKDSQLPIELSNALRAFFISLVNFFASSAKQQHEMTLRWLENVNDDG